MMGSKKKLIRKLAFESNLLNYKSEWRNSTLKNLFIITAMASRHTIRMTRNYIAEPFRKSGFWTICQELDPKTAATVPILVPGMECFSDTAQIVRIMYTTANAVVDL